MRTQGCLLSIIIIFTGHLGCEEQSPQEIPRGGAADAAPLSAVPELRRLTRQELLSSLRYVLGPVSVVSDEPDLYQGGLARVGARYISTSASGVERQTTLVDAALEQVFADASHRNALIGCAPDTFGQPACVEDFVRRVGQRAFRRPLDADEVARYVDLQAQCFSALGDFDLSLRCVTEGFLLSPHFLYRVELPINGVYTGYAMASRLAYFLWSRPPDDALLNAAYRGQLDTPEGVRAQATRMLESPWARDGLARFVDEWYRTDRLDRLKRDVLAQTAEPVQFTLGRDGQLQPWLEWITFAAGEELRRMVVGHVFDDDADYVKLLTTDQTFVDPHLEAFYELGTDGGDPMPVASGERADEARLSVEGSADALGFARARHTANSPRRGILGTMAILSQLGKQNETSPTRRGLYVMEHVLCLEVGAPPDNIDICNRPDGVSRRESMELHHMCAPACAGCHVQMDPPGFALDGFDTIGRIRQNDDWGFELDTQVTWTMNDHGTTQELSFNSLRTMAETFENLPAATHCVTKQVFRFATGRHETPEDDAQMKALTDAFTSQGRKLKAFFVPFVGTDAFRKTEVVSSGPTDPNAPVTLAQISRNVFSQSCTPCHVGSALGGLDLKNDDGLSARLRAASLGAPDLRLVTPGDLQQSYLWHKVSATHANVGGSGEPMPPNGMLDVATLELIRTWIAGGAQ